MMKDDVSNDSHERIETKKEYKDEISNDIKYKIETNEYCPICHEVYDDERLHLDRWCLMYQRSQGIRHVVFKGKPLPFLRIKNQLYYTSFGNRRPSGKSRKEFQEFLSKFRNCETDVILESVVLKDSVGIEIDSQNCLFEKCYSNIQKTKPFWIHFPDFNQEEESFVMRFKKYPIFFFSLNCLPSKHAANYFEFQFIFNDPSYNFQFKIQHRHNARLVFDRISPKVSHKRKDIEDQDTESTLRDNNNSSSQMEEEISLSDESLKQIMENTFLMDSPHEPNMEPPGRTPYKVSRIEAQEVKEAIKTVVFTSQKVLFRKYYYKGIQISEIPNISKSILEELVKKSSHIHEQLQFNPENIRKEPPIQDQRVVISHDYWFYDQNNHPICGFSLPFNVMLTDTNTPIHSSENIFLFEYDIKSREYSIYSFPNTSFQYENNQFKIHSDSFKSSYKDGHKLRRIFSFIIQYDKDQFSFSNPFLWRRFPFQINSLDRNNTTNPLKFYDSIRKNYIFRLTQQLEELKAQEREINTHSLGAMKDLENLRTEINSLLEQFNLMMTPRREILIEAIFNRLSYEVWIFYYIRSGRLDLAFKFLEKYEESFNIERTNSAGHTLLYIAVSHGHYNTVHWCLEHGKANPNFQTRYWKFTPLHRACIRKDKDLQNLLLKYGADPNLRDVFGNTAKFYCKQPLNVLSSPDIAFSIVMANSDERFPISFWYATRLGWNEVVKMYINEVKCPLTVKSGLGLTPLITAIQYEREEIIRTILDAALLDVQTYNRLIQSADILGATAFHYAVGRPEILKILLDHISHAKQVIPGVNIDLNVQDLNGNSPLFYSICMKKYESIHLLLQEGVEMDIYGTYNEHHCWLLDIVKADNSLTKLFHERRNIP